ncbi:MAG TPA: YhjD/YihY/BrkB family envelope integrity protein [Parasegetibacter sp.]
MQVLNLIKDTIKELNRNDPLRLAGATAFFTTFSLPAIILIIIQIMGLVINPQTIGRQLFVNLSDIVGRETTVQVISTLKAFREMAQNWLVTILGFIFLLFVATTLFKVIKGSLNQLWKIRVVRRLDFRRTLIARLKAMLIIILAGILLVIGILAEGAQAFLGSYIEETSPLVAVYFKSSLNYLISIITVAAWFSMVFHFLPDGRPVWKINIVGALVTSLLFNLGKLILKWLLSYSNINTFFGTSASIVLLLLFVFYTSLIFYFGASFTKIWAIYKGKPIKPLPHAMHYDIVEKPIK